MTQQPGGQAGCDLSTLLQGPHSGDSDHGLRPTPGMSGDSSGR